MKTKRTFASLCLALSCCALIAASNVSVGGDQAGVVRLTSGQEQFAPPVPPANDPFSGQPMPDSGFQEAYGQGSPPMYAEQGAPFYEPMAEGYPMESGMPMMAQDFSPYFQSSGVTEAPVLGRRPQDNPLFGPQLMFETNIDNGLGFNEAYHRANARLPYHVVPGSSVLIGDLSASLTNNGTDLYNFGVVWRNYDAMRNRVFGWNAFFDVDDGRGNATWKRVGVGVESLGKYIDFRANGYFVQGEDSRLLTDSLVGDLALAGNNIFRVRNQTRDNAYSGADVEVGGPLPFLGRRGINSYIGGYYLDNDMGHETVGFSSRIEALVTESASVNVHYTNDDTFGVNGWVSIAYTIPNYGERKIFQPRNVRDRLADPVVRSSRIHSNIDMINVPVAAINDKTGNPFNIVYVDPNAAAIGTGTFESPYSTLQLAANNNNAAIDIIRVAPNADDSGTNLTVNGGLPLFECQTLLSSVQDYTLFVENNVPFMIPGTTTDTNLGPLISNPTMGVGDSVVQVTNSNTVWGMRIDGANAAGTVFGTGISNALPLEDINISRNVFTNYRDAVDLQNVSGAVVMEDNTATGLSGASESGLVLTTSTGSLTNLLIRNNRVNNSQFTDETGSTNNTAIIEATTVGISVTANSGATINADDPDGFGGNGMTGILDNVVSNSGDGIVVTALANSTVNVVAENNVSFGNARNGFIARADGAGSRFNLYSLRNNRFGGEDRNGDGRLDSSEDLNGNGVLDLGEDLNGDGILNPSEDANGNGILDPGEDLDGDGVLDPGEDRNGDGILAASEDVNNNGILDATEDLDGNGLLALGNGENGAFLHYRNGGSFFAATEDTNEDANLNGFLDLGEDLNLNGILDVANGVLNDAEALNTNGRLDQGIVSNLFSNNGNVGLCIFGEGSGTGTFTIGGLSESLGNISRNNSGSGIAIDLRDTAVAQVDSMFNRVENSAFVGTYSTTVQAAFDMTGDTFGSSAFLDNQSASADILDFTWNLDLAAGIQDFEFDTTSPILRPPGNPFLPQNGTENTTGLIAVNGFGVPPYDNTNGLLTNLDRNQRLTLSFVNDAAGLGGFDSIDQLEWVQDIDRVSFTADTFPDDTVIANELAGTTAVLRFRDDFTGIGVQSTRTVLGTMVQSPTDPAALQLRISQTFTAPQFNPDPRVTGDGIRINMTGSSKITSLTSINDTILQNKGDGFSVVANGSSTVEALTVQGALIAQSAGRGLNIEALDSAIITANSTIGGYDTRTLGRNIIGDLSFSEGNTIRQNRSDGVRFLAADSGVINANLINNTIEENLGNGASLVVDGGGTLNFGNAANNELISRNTIRANSGAGIRLTSEVEAGKTGLIDAFVRNNRITENEGGGIVSAAFGPSQSNLINLSVGGTDADSNVINQNSVVGVGYRVAGNASGVVNIANSTITNTNGDGIALGRSDSALLTANINDVSSIGNSGDGLDVDVQGNDRNDPNQPMTGTVNTVDWTNNNFSNNGQNGARFRVRGDAQLIADGTNNVVSNNALNGILVQTSETASFGDPTVGLPPGRRVIFDGTIANGNGQDGLNILATEQSRAMVQVTSNRIPASTAAHAALNTNGDSSFSNNGRDGIRIETTGGRSDIDITAGSGSTTIAGNGTVAGGNGIRWDSSGTSDATVRVTRTSIIGNIAGATEDLALNGNGVLDPGEDINRNGILDGNVRSGTFVGGEDGNDDVDVEDGDGIQFNVFGTATSTLVVGGIGDGNLIQNNQDDGIAISATGQDLNISRPVIAIVGNTIGGENDGIQAGNGGDGVSLNILGGTDDVLRIGADPGSIDTDLNGGVSFSNGLTEAGPIVQLTMTDNLVSNNTQRGVNLLLHGAAGDRDRESGLANFDPVRITMTGNTIVSNGTEGIFFRGDSNMNQGRLTYLANFPFPDPPFNPADDRPRTFANYDPNQIEFLSDNFGSVNGNTAFSSEAPDGAVGYLNLRTVQNTFLTLVGNTVQNNGVGTVTGEGLVLAVGTGSYLAADVRNNIFGGNLEEDIRTESFLSAGNTYASVDDAGDSNLDAIYHDDSAQLDMRFLGNSGNQILLTSDGATYTNGDSLKQITQGVIGVLDRDAAFFQVDDGGNLDNPNNTFINFGITQDIDGAFIGGRFNLRGAADPLFPNIGFAPFLP